MDRPVYREDNQVLLTPSYAEPSQAILCQAKPHYVKPSDPMLSQAILC